MPGISPALRRKREAMGKANMKPSDIARGLKAMGINNYTEWKDGLPKQKGKGARLGVQQAEYKKLKKAHERMQEEATTHNLVRATAMSGAMVMGMARDLALLKAAQPQLHFAPATAPAFDPASVSDKELREAFESSSELAFLSDGSVSGPADAVQDLEGLKVQRGVLDSLERPLLIGLFQPSIPGWATRSLYVNAEMQDHFDFIPQVASAVQQEPLAPHPSGLVDRIRFMGVGAIDGRIMSIQGSAGHGALGLHKDSRTNNSGGYGDTIVTATLRGGAFIVFKTDGGRCYRVWLQAGDVYAISGSARTKAQHGVVPTEVVAGDCGPACTCRMAITIRIHVHGRDY